MKMRRALFITAANRPEYFRETMNSWRKVRGFYDWHVFVRLEPTDRVPEHNAIIEELEHEKIHVQVNPQVYGVLHHPWVGFEELFRLFEFVVRAEDDLLVSDDVLEFFEWASETYRDDQEIAAVVAHSKEDTQYHIESIRRDDQFSPWVWGTWQDRWAEYISDTWDHDYSTYNGSPGNQAGWDWNLDTRVLPSLGKKVIHPVSSRVKNIGVYGVHGTPDNFVTSENFQATIPPGLHYRESTR